MFPNNQAVTHPSSTINTGAQWLPFPPLLLVSSTFTLARSTIKHSFLQQPAIFIYLWPYRKFHDAIDGASEQGNEETIWTYERGSNRMEITI
jgi:hypothetical protein